MILIRRSITRPLTLLANEKKEQYRTGRVLEQLNRLKDSDQKTLLEGMLQDIRNFAGDAEQFDDITMLGLTYKGDGSAKPDARS
jgi:sigma-B regulation protein RsbU (phosphoserine phosphatase)